MWWTWLQHHMWCNEITAHLSLLGWSEWCFQSHEKSWIWCSFCHLIPGNCISTLIVLCLCLKMCTTTGSIKDKSPNFISFVDMFSIIETVVIDPLFISTDSSVWRNLMWVCGCIVSHECFPLSSLVLCVSSPCVGAPAFGGGSCNRKLQKERMHVRSRTVPSWSIQLPLCSLGLTETHSWIHAEAFYSRIMNWLLLQ